MKKLILFSYAKRGIIFLILTVGILGFIPDSRLDFRLGKQILAEWSMLLFIALFLIRNKWMSAFVVWMLICSILRYNILAYATLNTIFVGVMFYVTIIERFKKEDVVRFLNIICTITLIQVGWMILQFFGIWPLIAPKDVVATYDNLNVWVSFLPRYNMQNITGFMDNVNMASSLFAITLPLFFRKRWYWGIPFVWIGLILSRSLGGLVPATLIMAYFILRERRLRLFMIPLSIAVAFYLWRFETVYTTIMGGERFPFWKQIIQYLIPKHWIMGHGTGQFCSLFTGTIQRARVAHNEYLQVWVDYGIIGLGLIGGYVISILRKGFKIQSHTAKLIFIAILASLLNAGVNFLGHTIVFVIVLILLALFEKEINYAASNTTEGTG